MNSYTEGRWYGEMAAAAASRWPAHAFLLRTRMCAALARLLAALPLAAQRVLVLPGSQLTSAYSFPADPLGAPVFFSPPAGSFKVFANPDATRYYIVSQSGVNTVDSGGAAVPSPIPAALPVVDAAQTPDGRQLLVLVGDSTAGTLQIVDLTRDPPRSGKGFSFVLSGVKLLPSERRLEETLTEVPLRTATCWGSDTQSTAVNSS